MTGASDPATALVAPGQARVETAVLDSIQRRVLWLATRMIDHANRGEKDEIKVGGHQASSASMVSIMTALWFGHLEREDKVAVKPHASPVYHAIKYLTGELERSYLTQLRRYGGLQAYPSRTKDPDVSDFSTGSVGLGAVAPLFAAATRRYIEARWGRQAPARFIGLVGDAELDEGSVWEAIAEPALRGLGNVMLVVDVNRQSLDRVVPGMKIRDIEQLFKDAGWHVTEAKYGSELERLFRRPGGESLRDWLDEMSNEEYQSTFALAGPELRQRIFADADPRVHDVLADVADQHLPHLIHDLGGHDLELLLRRYRECDQVGDRPSVVFAYTVKGWGLPFAGDPLNHSALLAPDQISELRKNLGFTEETQWDRFPPGTPEGELCSEVGRRINNPPPRPRARIPIPTSAGVPNQGRISTQTAFGRILGALADSSPIGERIVTASPDVSISTNLGQWINKVGVFHPHRQEDHLGEGRLLRWTQGPEGRHIELGLSEVNLFLLLGQLGLSFELHGETVFPVGTVYDPFVLRGLDAFVYGLYSAARFIVVGTPSGITLAPEGGAHQSSITPSVGLELPGITFCEPAYAQALDWLFCDALERLQAPDGESTYLRLTTRPIDQSPFHQARERLGEEALRKQVLAGGYALLEADPDTTRPLVNIFGSGPVLSEILEAAELLRAEGVAVSVFDVTSADRLYRGWRDSSRRAVETATLAGADFHLARLLRPPLRRAPIVTVHDAASHAMAWIGSVFGTRTISVGVDEFGQSGTIPELYEAFGLRPEQIVNAALVAIA